MAEQEIPMTKLLGYRKDDTDNIFWLVLYKNGKEDWKTDKERFPSQRFPSQRFPSQPAIQQFWSPYQWVWRPAESDTLSTAGSSWSTRLPSPTAWSPY
eukprot:g50624.t1